MRGRRRRVDAIPAEQSAVIGANIRALRLRNGWTQAKLGELMGWPTNATVCAAEGHRAGRQRGFSAEEVTRLADIFGVSLAELTTRCVNCGGHPPRLRRPVYFLVRSCTGLREPCAGTW
jgi:transcriptional regulator with XRE-family HTH domain